MGLDPSILDPTRGVNVLRADNPLFLAAEAITRELIERAQLNEALIVVSELEAEVTEMTIASRFSACALAKPRERDECLNPEFKGLTERDYKRRQLLLDLAVLKSNLNAVIGGLSTVIMDIQATKAEG